MTESSAPARGPNEPQHPDPSSFGVDPATGVFKHPAATPFTQGPRPVRGSLDYIEDKEYLHNMTVEGRWPKLVVPGVSFQNIIDMNGRRYMYHYYRTRVNVYDITDAKRLEVLLEKKYVPVVSPVGLGEDGEGYNINADAAAAEIAIALKAEKLIYLTDVPGILDNGELVSELTASELSRKIADGTVRGGMVAKAKSVLRAIEGGVASVHILDGRTPHSVIAELFTDRGVGTLVRKD